MYTLTGICGYCNAKCSRIAEDDGKLPRLQTPGVFAMKQVVCEPCMVKLHDALSKMYEGLIKCQQETSTN